MASRIILTFHGLGGDRRAMLPIVDYCSRLLEDTEFRVVEGPFNHGTALSPVLGWFTPPGNKNRALEGENWPALNGLEESLAVVHKTIDDLVAAGMDPQAIHLLGHSQGGAMAIAAGLMYPARLGSVCTIAGYLALTRDLRPVTTGTPYFLHHAEQDDNVGVRWAHYAQRFVEGIGESCEVRCWDIPRDPHSIHAEQLDAICATIAAV